MSGSEASLREANTDGGPLAGLRVLDFATVYAGPFAAMMLGDFGAEVIKVEHPRGDPMRTQAQAKNGHGLWWKMISRNKLTTSLDLSKPEGQEIALELVRCADVLIENFRPGVMERWNLGYECLAAVNPGLVMLRMTGFGQFGPYAARPGFGTLAESMSGFAHITGEPDGPPTLPPFGLADGIAGLAAAMGVMFALYNRDARGGKGQMIDISLIEPLLMVLGPQAIVYDQLGIIQERTGNRTAFVAPRNTYKSRDGRWVAISTSANPVAERLMRLVGHEEVITEPWFTSGVERARHADELDIMVGGWIAERDFEEVIRACDEAGAAVAPIYDIAQVMADPQYQALKTFVTVEDDDLGPMKMQNVIMRMLNTPGKIKFTGRGVGHDNDKVYRELLGLTRERLAELKAMEVI